MPKYNLNLFNVCLNVLTLIAVKVTNIEYLQPIVTNPFYYIWSKCIYVKLQTIQNRVPQHVKSSGILFHFRDNRYRYVILNADVSFDTH